MQRWRPAPSAGGLVGLLAFLLSVAAMAGVVLRVIPGTSGAAQVASWALVALLAVPAGGGPARQLLRPPVPVERRWLWPWPGYYLASVDDEALGRVQLLATVPPRRQLLV